MLPGKFFPILMLSVGIVHSLFRRLLSGKNINQISMKEVQLSKTVLADAYTILG